MSEETLYCTNHPCIICSKMIINAGIERIVYEEGYADALSAKMLRESGIKIERFERNQKTVGKRQKPEGPAFK